MGALVSVAAGACAAGRGDMVGVQMISPLTAVSTEMTRDELAEHEAVIERGLQTFVDVGLALKAIRDGKGYRFEYGTFENYCRERWKLGQSRVYQLMDAAEIIGNLKSSTVVELPITERQARPLAQLEPEQQREAWQKAVETAPNGKITAAHVEKIVDEIKRPVSYHISDDSYEWYTPADVIETAREVLGDIDLDPATSLEANDLIQAPHFYTKEDDGLKQKWFGRVWLNPPYNMPLIENFVDRVIAEYESGNLTGALVLTNNSTDTGWFHKLFCYPVCFTRGRLQFWNGDDRLATRQGQAIFYLGKYPERFAHFFSPFGVVVRRYDYTESREVR